MSSSNYEDSIAGALLERPLPAAAADSTEWLTHGYGPPPLLPSRPACSCSGSQLQRRARPDCGRVATCLGLRLVLRNGHPLRRALCQIGVRRGRGGNFLSRTAAVTRNPGFVAARRTWTRPRLRRVALSTGRSVSNADRPAGPRTVAPPPPQRVTGVSSPRRLTASWGGRRCRHPGTGRPGTSVEAVHGLGVPPPTTNAYGRPPSPAAAIRPEWRGVLTAPPAPMVGGHSGHSPTEPPRACRPISSHPITRGRAPTWSQR
jgi:hypothetical protein